jgi:two-component system, NarL family, sensor histidine kinase UhpB
MTLLKTDSLNILVVEDNPGDFLLLKENISLSGISAGHIHLTETLDAAIDYLKHNKPQVIFLDLYLPDSHGLESFEQLKKYTTNSVVIVLSGLSDTRVALEAISLGADDYLAKGEFDEKLLEKTVAYSIERRRNLEKLRIANERYSLVSKATNDLVWDWDLLTDEVYRDEQGLQQVYGFTSNSAIRHNAEWSKRIHPDDAAVVLDMIQEIKMSTDKNFFELEYKFATETGDYKIINDRGYVVRNAEGNAIRLIGAAQDITEKRKFEATMEEFRIRQQKAITAATIKGQENERKQLGIELHDNINQILATSKLYLDFALAAPVIDNKLIIQSKEYILLATQEIRKLSHALLPPSFEEFGLKQSLDDLVDSITVAANFKISKRWDDFDEQVLQKDQKLTIYRIVQEQLNNILKHAAASHVIIAVGLAGEAKNIRLLVKDDGKGFNMESKRNGVGLRNIISRADLFGGKATIQSSPGNGCELEVTFPSVAA